MTSKLLKKDYDECVASVLKPNKQRKFRETIELQIGLKDYDPKKDKRFSGAIKLPNVCKDTYKICIIGDAAHIDEAKALGLEFIDVDGVTKFNKDKKIIKKWAKKYDLLLATDTIAKKLPKIMGPTLNKIGMFPQVITHKEPLKDRMNELKTTVKFQLKKVLCIHVAIGHVNLSEDELRTNLTMAVNFLVSLLKKQWNNVKSLNVKSTMGAPYRLYG